MSADLEPRRWIDALAPEIERAGRGDPEGIHHLRVVLARLRVFCELSRTPSGITEREPKDRLAEQLRELRGLAAPQRDIWVQLARPDLPAEFEAELRREQASTFGALRRALRSRHVTALLRTLEELPAAPRDGSERAVACFADQALAYGDALRLDAPIGPHALRRAVRRTRFGLEWLGGTSERLVALQSALGELHDGWVALERARRAEDPAALRGYRRTIRAEYAEVSRKIPGLWRRARPKLIELLCRKTFTPRRTAPLPAGVRAGAA